MKVIKAGDVKILNGVTCPNCGAVYDDVKPTDTYWVGDMYSYRVINCLYCGEKIKVD